jgi:hypothetical protein
LRHPPHRGKAAARGNGNSRESAVEKSELDRVTNYLRRLFGNPNIRIMPRPKKEDSAEVYIGEEFIAVLFLDDEEGDRSYTFQMAILQEDL